MKAVQFVDGGVETLEVDYPKVGQEADWSILEISSSGICGSDLHMVDIGIFPPNLTMGHEFCGILPDGTAAAIEPIRPCGQCDRCQEGRYNLCDDIMSSIAGMGAPGGMAEAIAVHKSQIVPLPKGASPNNALLVEPLAVCVHGFERLNIAPETYLGMKVAIIGGGTIGQCALTVARSYGADVTLISRHAIQHRAAEQLGANLQNSNSPASYDLVVDAAGTESALAQAVSLARSGAKMLLLATYWGGMVMPGIELCMKEIDVIPAIMYCAGTNSTHSKQDKHQHGADFIEAANILANTPELPEAIITHRFGLSEAKHAFEVASDRKAGAIKVALDPKG